MRSIRSAAIDARPSRPQARGRVFRERLFHELDELSSRSAMWIGAPAGSGKSTLVSTWVEAGEYTCLWHQVEASDAEPATLLHYLARLTSAPRRARALPHLGAEYVTDLEAFAATFFNAFYARLEPGTVLVFDDAHLLDDTAAKGVLAAAIACRPASVKLVFCARGRPPRTLARQLASGALSLFDARSLRFTFEEAARMLAARSGGPLDASLSEKLCERAEGWAAGLALLATGLRAGSRSPEPVAATGLSAVFDYFAAELFDDLPVEARTFLLRTCVAPRLTVEVARDLSRDRRCRELLEQLWRQDVFTSRTSGRADLYELHPLFRGFLVERARRELDPSTLAELRRQAAAGLEEAGQVDTAAELLMEAEAHESLAALVRRRAPELEKARRWATLERWLRALPARQLEADPWLAYLLGVARLPFDTVEARAHFESALVGFRSARDRSGAFLAWARGVESIVLEYGTFQVLDRWLALFDELKQELGFALSAEAFVRVSVSRFDALLHRRPLSPELPDLEVRLRRLMTVVPDLSARVLLGACLSRYYALTGQLSAARSVRTRLGRQVESSEVEPVVRAVWTAMHAVLGWLVGSPREGLAEAHAALEVTRGLGIRLFDFRILVQGAYSALAMGRNDEAERFLERMPDTFTPERRLDMGQHVWLIGWAQLARGNAPSGLEHMLEAVEIARSVGVPYVLARAHHGLSQALRCAGDLPAAGRALESCRAQVGDAFPLVTYIAGLSEAELRFDEGDVSGGREALARAFELGQRLGYASVPHWTPGQLAALCARALEATLSPDYARSVIQIHELQALGPARPLDGWPWPLALRTLGRLSLVKDGAEDITRELSGKPLELLEALVALGGDGVHDSRLVEALWPDAEGDRGRDALKMNLSRLRRVIGADALEVVDRRVSLRRERVWVDALVLADMLSRLHNGPLPADAVADLAEATTLFRGPFLPDVPDAAWAIPQRERLGRRYLVAVQRVGSSLRQAGRAAEADDVYREAREVVSDQDWLRAGFERAMEEASGS